MKRGYVIRTPFFQKTSDLFNETFPVWNPIVKSAVTKYLQIFEEEGPKYANNKESYTICRKLLFIRAYMTEASSDLF